MELIILVFKGVKMKELISQIDDLISNFETKSTHKSDRTDGDILIEQLAVKTIYQIKELIIQSKIDLQKIRESGL